MSGAWVLVSSRASRSRVLGCLLLRELQAPASGHIMLIKPIYFDHTYARVLGCLLFFKKTKRMFVLKNSQAPKHPPSCCLKLLAGVGNPLARRVLVKVLVHKHPSTRHENLTYYMTMFTYTA